MREMLILAAGFSVASIVISIYNVYLMRKTYMFQQEQRKHKNEDIQSWWELNRPFIILPRQISNLKGQDYEKTPTDARG